MFSSGKLVWQRVHLLTGKGFSTLRPVLQAQNGGSKSNKSHWSSTLDRSMIYPGILLILFGSQVINVMNSQKYIQDLERVYKAKISKIDEIIARLESGEKGIDVHEELKLVNMMFERQMHGGKMKLGKEYEVDHDVAGYHQKSEHVDLHKELKEEDFMKMLGLHEETNKKKPRVKSKGTVHKETVITDEDEIREQTDKQKKLTSFVVVPETHVIVENPGDYIDAAKDTKLSKFL